MVSESNERRFYIMRPGNGDPSDFEFVNESEALVDGRNHFGIRKISVPSYPRPLSVGLPILLATPKLIIGSRRKEVLDRYGFSTQFVSDRAKRLLEKVDPGGFEFARCEATDWRSHVLESFWFARAIRVFDAFDEEQSNFVTYRERNSDDPEKEFNPAIVELNSLIMNNDFPTDIHVFYLARYQRAFIVDDFFVDGWVKSNLSGASFVPLQYFTKEEEKHPSLFQRNTFTRQKGS